MKKVFNDLQQYQAQTPLVEARRSSSRWFIVPRSRP